MAWFGQICGFRSKTEKFSWSWTRISGIAQNYDIILVKRSCIHLMIMSGVNALKVVIGQCIRHQLLIQTGCIVVNAHPTLLTADAAAGCAFARNVVLLLG